MWPTAWPTAEITAEIKTKNGETKKATAPLILSVSRATDIPAFYMSWFMKRLEEGYVRWVNPYSKRDQFVSLEKTRFVVFWTKNPAPMFDRLDELEEYDFSYYIQHTLNDYETEGLEPGLTNLDRRIETFVSLSERIGKERVIWRFDPLFLQGKLQPDDLLERIRHIGDSLAGKTEKLVFSFADIDNYKKVKANLRRAETPYRNWFTPESLLQKT